MGRLDNKVAIVTGAARGIGSSIALRFTEEGATVVLTDILGDVHETAEKFAGQGLAKVSGYEHDVTSQQAWQEIINEVIGQYGKIDVLVNNAGVLLFKTIRETSLEEFQKVHKVNVAGSFLGVKLVAEQMIKQRQGSIINIASVDGTKGSNGLCAYGSSKFAVRGLTKVAAMELGLYGVRVNAVLPGGMNTAMGNPFDLPAERVNDAFQNYPAQRIGDPREVADACLYLASDDSSYCFGTEIKVDGGLTAGDYYQMAPGSPEAVQKELG